MSVVGVDQIRRDLDLRLDLSNHSPTGFAWGYEGSGPAQLSLALLADALGDDERALRLYQPFKSAYIAGIPQDKEWALSASLVYSLARAICTSELLNVEIDPVAGLPVRDLDQGKDQ